MNLASAASTRSLGSTSLGVEDWNSESKKQILTTRGSTLPMGNALSLTQQSAWDKTGSWARQSHVSFTSGEYTQYTDQCNRARLSSPHSRHWLLTLPISLCGLCFDNEAFKWRSANASALSYRWYDEARTPRVGL